MAKRRNSTSKPSTSSRPYKGVRMRSWGSWVSEIRAPRQNARIWLGSYSTPEAAARAYNAALICLKGSSADLSFPDSDHHQPTTVLDHKSIQRVAAAAANNDPALGPPSSPPLSPLLSSPPLSLLLSDVTEGDEATTSSCEKVMAEEVDQWLEYGAFESPRFMDLWLGQCGAFAPVEDQCHEEGDLISLWSFS